jgi:hypothetical protein
VIKPNFWPRRRKKRDSRYSANQIHVFFQEHASEDWLNRPDGLAG